MIDGSLSLSLFLYTQYGVSNVADHWIKGLTDT